MSDFLPGFHRRWSGAELVCHRLWRALEKIEQDVILLTTPFETEERNNRVFQIPTPLIGLLGLIQFDPLSVFSCLRILKKERPDIIHLHSKMLSLSLFVAAKILRIPLVFMVLDYWIMCPKNILKRYDGSICGYGHGLKCVECFFHTKFGKVIVLLRSQMVKMFANKLDAIITFSETSKKRLRSYGVKNKNIHVIYSFYENIEKDNVNHLSPFARYSIFFVGSFDEHKGLQVIIKALYHIVKEIPSTHLRVIGTGDTDDKEKILNLVNQLGLNDHITFLGKKENREVLKLMKLSDVVVIAEQWLNDFGPLALVEAMSLSKPVVAGKIGAVPEFLRNSVTGLMVKYDEPESFAEGILWMFNHPLKVKQMGVNAQKSVQFLNETLLCNKILDLYSSVVNC